MAADPNATASYTEAPFDNYKDGTITGSRGDRDVGGRTDDEYDVNGNLVSVTDSQKASDGRRFINDANGVILLKYQEGQELQGGCRQRLAG